MGSEIAMKLVAFLVFFNMMGNYFVECKRFHRGSKHGHGSHESGSKHGHGSHESGGGSGCPISQSGQTVVVSQDGSGNYNTIKEALDASQGQSDINIYVKSGVYEEYLFISESMKNVRLNGDGKGATIISGNHGDSPSAGNYKLYNSATVVVEGDGFVACGITFRNTAGPEGNQAAAIRVEADEVAFYECGFEGFQDTVYVHKGRHFFKNCDISGDIDFICGAAAAVFQDCNIILRRPKTPNGEITIATSSRQDPSANQGLVFQRCSITANPDIGEAKIYLGRPWKPYSETVFMETSIDVPLQPAGWRPWEDGDRSNDESSVVYREYNNRGIGANTEGRVQWQGFKVITDQQEAEQFTVANFLQGNEWIPRTGISYIDSL